MSLLPNKLSRIYKTQLYSRRTFLKLSAALTAILAGGFFFKGSKDQKVKHILSSASHEKLAVTLSLSQATSEMGLLLDDDFMVKGTSTDSEGKHWQFIVNNLSPNKSYKLQLVSENQSIYKAWSLKTFPKPNSEIDSLKVMSFTCPVSYTHLTLPTTVRV